MMDADNRTVAITERNIASLDAGDSINITVPWTARLKVGDDISHNRTIKVEAEPDNEYTEDNSTNNTGYSDTITVKRSRDFSVTNITFSIGNETLDPMNMSIGGLATINATIEIANLASCGGSVDVSCYLDNTTPIETNRTVSFPANNGTEYVEFKWDVHVHGNHTITVIADPGNETSEFDESNNKFDQSIYIRAPNLTVTTMTFDPESPEVDSMVNIIATVENLGNEGVTNANLTIYDCYKEYIVECADYYSIPEGGQHTFGRDAAAMRLYLELSPGGSVGIYDSHGIQMAFCDAGFSGWTPWVFGNCTAKVLEVSFHSVGIRVKKINYLTEHDLIHTKNYSLMPGDTANITVNRCVNTTGTHAIIAIVDPKKLIMESDESNNGLSEAMVVQGADLTVPDMRLTVNGTEINESTVIEYGKVVNINATISNIGIRPANNFNVSFFADTTEIANAINLNLTEDESINISASWDTIIGDYTIKVIADPENRISETNESNNTQSKSVVVRGADLSITETNIIWGVIPPEGATINETGGEVYDTDTVMINATIVNEGIVPARNFSVNIFYEYGYLGRFSRACEIVGDDIDRWVNKSCDGADGIYVHVSDTYNIGGRLIIYAGDGTEVARPNESCWIAVIGDMANIKYRDVHGLGVRVDFYAGDITKIENQSLAYGESMNVSVMQCVNTGDHPVRVFIDPENKVHENSKSNNIADAMIQVHPSRDFAADLRLFCNGTEIDVNDTMLDGDTVLMNTIVGMGINESDPYHRYRKGIAEVEVTDEHDWVDISPRCELTPHGYAQVIRYPGSDAIKVHFRDLNIPPGGQVWIRDKNWTVQWSHGHTWIRMSMGYDENSISTDSSWVEGDTVYVYKAGSPWERITYDIDRYQYRRINNVNMPLNASETKNIIAEWDVSAWNHTMRAIVDPDDNIGEIDESNNEACKTLNVDACKDPAVVDLTFNPQKPAMGTDVTINASIMNKGNRTADFTVDLWAEKIEYHPFESPHGDDFPHWICDDTGCGWRGVGGLEWTIPSTYPDADWMGIHFTKLGMWIIDEGKSRRDLYVKDENGTVRDNFCGSGEEDVWAWVKGGRIKLETTKASFPVWGFAIDNHGYKFILNRTTLTLAPNETADVTGILRNVRAGNRSINYTIHANVDMDNVIYETDESNNEMIRTLNIAVPDFTVKIQPKQDGNIRAVFKNTGFGKMDVRIFFSREIPVDESVSGSYYCYAPNKTIRKSVNWTDDIDWTRIHFEEMKIRGGYVEVGDEQYNESKLDFWLPWVEKDRIKIKYRTARFKIDRYDFAAEDFINRFGGGDTVSLDVPWEGYAEPYNLTVWIDPLDEVLEGNEDDNNDTVIVYADLVADRIEFISPEVAMLSLDAGKFVIDGHIKNGGGDRDDIVAPVSDFNVTLEVRNRNPNGTVGDPVFNMTRHIEEPFIGQDTIRFEFNPKEKFEVGGNYTASLIADSTGDVCESNELYPDGEDNNVASVDVHVYNTSGYTGGGELINVAQGEVNGRVVYTVGDEGSCEWGMTPPGGEKTVTYTGVVPKGSGNIEFARLFVYWFTWDPGNPVLAGMDATFNDHSLTMAGNYSDNPGATMFDVGYGLYSYDVTKYVTKGENVATVTNNAEWDMGIQAIGLLVVYEDEDEPFTKYWVNEGADIMMAANSVAPTGLSDGDCITTAAFDDVERDDTENVNASLLTVLGFYAPYSGSSDALEFNAHSIGSKIGTGYWESHYRDTGIALTKDRWEDVTDDLYRGDNLAKIHSKGNFMMPNNAFLRLIFPPDLNVINLTAPASTVVGAP
jgi:subtilase family serine protease